MKKILLISLLFTLPFFTNTVEIINNTSKTIKIDPHEVIDGKKIMIYPITLKPSETSIDQPFYHLIASFIASVEENKESFGIVDVNENTKIEFVEKNGKIEIIHSKGMKQC